MSTQQFLTQELGLDLRKEGGSWLTRCPKCDRLDKLSISDDTCQFQCWACSYSGNAYTLMKDLTQFNTDHVWEKLKGYGLDKTSDRPVAKKQAKASIKADGYRYATDEELGRLAESKNVCVNALKKLGVLIDRKKPEIAVLPMHRRDLKRPCGGIRVRLDGQPCWYLDAGGNITDKDGEGHKPVKYPMIKDGLVGLLGSRWLKDEDPNTIILVEGFKDMMAAIEAGFVATTFGGCSGFSEDCGWQFQDRAVIILFDNDNAGQHHAPRQAERLRLYARETWIVPSWTEVKEKGGVDLHDYLTESEVQNEITV